MLLGVVQSSWTNGCGMVLVGDAVHASGRPDGQGGNLAFEDAVELAAYVRRHGLGQQVSRAVLEPQQCR
jgi:2-polyprenyl-6-methoxyphenol hydroxylase-like FAD-dependent oxidoreductase